MRSKCELSLCLSVALCGVLEAGPAGSAGQPPFERQELERFLDDVPQVLERMSEGGHYEAFARIVADSRLVEEHSEIAELLDERGWRGERFFYLFGRVLLGARMERMGGSGGPQLEQLLTRHAQVEAATNWDPEERRRALRELDRSINELRRTQSAIETIPVGELMLLRSQRNRIRELVGRWVKLEPREMRNPAYPEGEGPEGPP